MTDGGGRPAPDQARAGRPRLLPVAAVAAGVVLLAGSAVAFWQQQRGPTEPGADAAASLQAPAGRPAAATAGPLPQEPVSDGSLPSPADPRPPVRLELPTIGVTVRVDPVGVDPASGQFEVPPSVERVGWYRHGPGLAAEAGSVVIAGHVDSAADGRGAFYRLADLAPGDPVHLTDGAGRRYRFEVAGRRVHHKDELPLERYFARDGALRLTLITCGGPFDRAERSYRDNVVVTAAPAG